MQWLSYSAPLLEGAWVTVQLTFYSTILGAVVAFAFGIGKLSTNWFIKSLSIAFIEVFRGTSLLVQLFWLYFALPVFGQMIGVDLRLPAVVAGTLALSLNIGAYGAEVVRGAIQAVRSRKSTRFHTTPDSVAHRPAPGNTRDDAQFWQPCCPELKRHGTGFIDQSGRSGVPGRTNP